MKYSSLIEYMLQFNKYNKIIVLIDLCNFSFFQMEFKYKWISCSWKLKKLKKKTNIFLINLYVNIVVLLYMYIVHCIIINLISDTLRLKR